MTAAGARRERRLGFSTEDRFKSPPQAELLEALAACLCPFCGAGPFVVVAQHVRHKHGIAARDLREVAGLAHSVSICDATHSAEKRLAARDRDFVALSYSVTPRRHPFGGRRCVSCGVLFTGLRWAHGRLHYAANRTACTPECASEAKANAARNRHASNHGASW